MKSKKTVPNLFLLGVQKAGTTMLYDLFNGHPSIFLPDNKEPHFFNYEPYYQKGLEYYLEYYEKVKNQKYIGDFTPDYLFWPKAVERMQPYIDSDSRYIISLRQPVNRAYSQYNMMVSRGFNMNGFVSDLSYENIDTNNPEQFNLLRPSHMIARGLYSYQLERLFKIVNKSQVMVLIFEDWINDKESTKKKIENFLEIEHHNSENVSNSPSNQTLIYPSNPLLSKLKRVNSKLSHGAFRNSSLFLNFKEIIKQRIGNRPPKLSRQEIMELTNKYFLEDILKCEKILQKDLSIWYK